MNINWFQENSRQTILDAFIILKGIHWKNVTYTKLRVTIFVFKCQYLWPSNSLLRKYNQIGNHTLSFALF